jgi:hypothetical protein
LKAVGWLHWRLARVIPNRDYQAEKAPFRVRNESQIVGNLHRVNPARLPGQDGSLKAARAPGTQRADRNKLVTIQKSCSGQAGHFHGASGGEVNKKARAGWVEAGTEPDSHSSR